MERKEYTAVNFSNADFSKPLCGFTFTDCSFVDANMREAEIHGCKFIDCDMRGVDLSSSIISNTVFTSGSEYSLDLLCASYFLSSEFYGVRLKDARLTSARFVNSILEDSHYSGERDFVLVHTEWRD